MYASGCVCKLDIVGFVLEVNTVLTTVVCARLYVHICVMVLLQDLLLTCCVLELCINFVNYAQVVVAYVP